MKRKGIFCASIFLGVFLLCVPLVYGATVTAVGQAPIIGGDDNQARLKSIEGAKRAAVEQGVGTLVDSQTKVANFEVLQDKIYSRASGYITNYTILSEGKTPDGSLYTVTIRADVQTASIKNDLRAIGILMASVGNPRFMAVYVPETKSSARGVRGSSGPPSRRSTVFLSARVLLSLIGCLSTMFIMRSNRRDVSMSTWMICPPLPLSTGLISF